MTNGSMLDRIRERLLRIGVWGAAVLAIFVVLDFELLTPGGFAALGPWGVVHEMIDHLLFPLIVVFLPMLFATMKLVRAELAPLDQAAGRIDAAIAQGRGVRVDPVGLPLEAIPFTQAVNRLLERRDRSAELSEAFAADVAHELKTPLAILMLELERRDAGFAAVVRPELRRIDRLLDQLLTLAQLDACVLTPEPFEAVDLAEMARGVMAAVVPRALDRGVTLALTAPEHVMLAAKEEILATALRNLIDNAIRVTPAGGEVTVVVHATPAIEVIDGGPGISADRLAKLTERYYRADHASAEGAGLGLSIVSKVVAMHGGRLCADQSRASVMMVFD